MPCPGALVQACWGGNFGALCRGVSWARFGLEQLLEICDCVGGVGLSVVFRLMAEDHAGSSGEGAAAVRARRPRCRWRGTVARSHAILLLARSHVSHSRAAAQNGMPHHHSTGGLPDLLLWRPAPQRDARLVEVKGPTDRLSEQQRAWIAAMAGAGLHVEVCKVLEPS